MYHLCNPLVDTEGLINLIGKLRTCDTDYVFTNYYEVNDVTKELKEVKFPEIEKAGTVIVKIFSTLSIPSSAFF